MTKRKNRVGESIMTKHYGLATIIKYASSKDMAVQFEDGTISEHVSYTNFKSGRIANPSCAGKPYQVAKHHIGEIFYDTLGNPIECIDYNRTDDCTVKFSDGSIRKHVLFHDLSHGLLTPGDSRSNRINNRMQQKHIGEEHIMSCGMKAKIVKYIGQKNISIQFEDGAIKEHVAYSSFKIGQVKNPNINSSKINKMKKIYEGKTFKTNTGVCKVVNYNKANNILVEFEDGTKVKANLGDLKRGAVRNPNYSKLQIVGANGYTLAGVAFKVIKADTVMQNGKAVIQKTIQFSDGTLLKTFASNPKIKKGGVCHPAFLHFSKPISNPRNVRKTTFFADYELFGLSFAVNNDHYYYCRKIGSVDPTYDILTPAEMLSNSKKQEEAV